MPLALADFLAATDAPANRSLGEWILTDLPSSKQPLPPDYSCSHTSTAGLGETLPPREYHPDGIVEDYGLAETLVQYLTDALEHMPAADQQVSPRVFFPIQSSLQSHSSIDGNEPTEAGVTLFLNSMVAIVRGLNLALCQADSLVHKAQVREPRTAYVMDLTIETRRQIRWAIKVERAALLQRLNFRAEDLNVDVQNIQTLLHCDGGVLILFKLACWMRAAGVEFGLICDGQVYYILRLGDEGQVAISPEIALDSPDYPLIRVLLAVVLANCPSNSDRPIPKAPSTAAKVHVLPPNMTSQASQVCLAGDKISSPMRSRMRQLSVAQPMKDTSQIHVIPLLDDSYNKLLSTIQMIHLSMSTGKDRRTLYNWHALRRINYSDSPAVKSLSQSPSGRFRRSHEQPEAIACELGDYFAASETSHCFRLERSGLIFKLAANAKRKGSQTDLLRTEARIYEKSLRHLCGNALPVFYGCFVNEKIDVLVMSDVELSVQRFSDLDALQKERLHGIMLEVHACGVVHGDFAERNVTIDSEGQVHLIDFSHGSDGILCPGASCWELQDVRRQLELEKVV